PAGTVRAAAGRSRPAPGGAGRARRGDPGPTGHPGPGRCLRAVPPGLAVRHVSDPPQRRPGRCRPGHHGRRLPAARAGRGAVVRQPPTSGSRLRPGLDPALDPAPDAGPHPGPDVGPGRRRGESRAVTGPSGSTGPGAWPGLGFDPAPGEVTAVDWLTSGLIGASRTLLGARDTLDVVRTAPGGWEGDAARAFIAKVGQLPEQLGAAHASLDKAASALHRWQATLEQLQGRARDLEARAVAARRQLHEASAAAEAARRAPDLALAGRHFDLDAEPTDAQARLNSALTAVDDADRRLESARAGLERLISEGRRLLAEHGTAA